MRMPPGLILIPDWIDEATEASILALVPPAPPGLPRQPKINRMVRYGTFQLPDGIRNDVHGRSEGYRGPRRSYKPMNDGRDISVAEIPEALERLLERLVEEGLTPRRPNAVLLNEYLDGGRIGAHIDHRDSGDVIPILGMRAGTVLVFSKPGGPRIPVPFPRRALAVLGGPARHEWFHETQAAPPRVAAVFRTIGDDGHGRV